MLAALRRRVSGSVLARNALWITGGQFTSLVVQALSFVLLARFLGSREYGVLAGVVAFVALFSQYATAGSGTVFLRYVSIDRRNAQVYCGNVILCLGIFGTLLAAATIVAARITLANSSWVVIVLVAISDFFFRQVSVAAAQVFQAYEHMKMTALLTTATQVARLAAVGALLLLFHAGSAVTWAWASAAVSLLVATASAILVYREIHGVQFSLSLLRGRMKEGFGFAVAASVNAAFNDVDKTLLGHYGMDAANGIYTTAYRVIDISTTPMWSLYTSALPRMFREGKSDIRETLRTARKLLATGVLFGAVAGVGCFVCAPLLPLLAGHSFQESIRAIRWLLPLPVFRAFALSAGAGLTASGHQKMRTIMQFIAAGFNFGINLYLIPRYSWLGAAWSSLATDALMGAGNWGIYLVLCGRLKTGAVSSQGEQQENCK